MKIYRHCLHAALGCLHLTDNPERGDGLAHIPTTKCEMEVFTTAHEPALLTVLFRQVDFSLCCFTHFVCTHVSEVDMPQQRSRQRGEVRSPSGDSR